MKNIKDFSILHFSDLHFGEYSIQNDEKRPGDFKNYFTRFQTKVNYIIKNEIVNLVIISGDFCSKNLFFITKSGKKKLKRRNSLELPIYLKKFLDIFKTENIPIVICIGNHDIKRNIKKNEDRTTIYKELKELIKDYMNSDFSVNFDQNLINYKLYKREGILAFSIDTTFSLRDNNMDDPSIDLRGIEEFFDELESIGLKYSSFKKILVCHHPMREIHDFEDIQPYLIKKNIELILSGHFHQRYVDILHVIGTNKLFLNLIAGSPFLNLNKRKEGQLWNPVNSQFNYYILSGLDWEQLSGDYYIYNDNKIWEKRKLLPSFSILYGSLNWLERIKDKTKNHPSEELIRILKEYGNQTEDEEIKYITWVFHEFIKKYSFKLEEIEIICKYFRIQVENFFSDLQNFVIIEEVFNHAGINKGEKSEIFLENLKRGKKIWLGTIRDFKKYLIRIFNLNEGIVEEIYQESFNEMIFDETFRFSAITTEAKIENIENDERIKSTLEAINTIFAHITKDSKFKRIFRREVGHDITDLHDILLTFAAQSLANSLLNFEGVFLFNWRERLQSLIKKYANVNLKDTIPRSSNLKNYIDNITNYTLILAKDNIENLYNY